MGAKQSKRSVDISGKDAEGAGEVAAAGAVVGGRVEALADVDALKPQLNGDAHIHEQTDKEKQLDSGTPENEKDATTEKQGKEQENDSEKEVAPVTNGDTEPKGENGDSTPTPEEGKKPKKEKVKKKWSLRSISFSRKDKPKQERKQKEEEPKTNGEPEKVPEEAAEATPETTANDVPPEAKSETEIKEEKTPETPVTEPLTNGSSTPESPKVETPPVEEAAPVPTSAPAPAASPEPERQESKAETQPEQLPVNGLSLEEPKPEVPEVAQVEQSKPDEQLTAETTETVPAPEIPVKKEVCVEQMPLESPPPPLPANPPPSSVASFAATTMAPELTDASLANTAELAISAPHSIPDIKTEIIAEITPAPAAPPTCTTNIDIVNIENVATTEIAAIEIVATELSPPLKETSDKKQSEVEVNPQPETAAVTVVVESNVDTLESIRDDHTEMRQATGDQADIMNIVHEDQIEVKAENVSKIEPQVPSDFDMVPEIPADLLDTEPLVDMLDNVEDLPPPPPPIADEDLFDKDDDVPNEDVVVPNNIGTMNEIVVNSNHISENTNLNGVATENVNGNDEVKENLKNKAKDMLGNLIETAECNGNVEQVEDKIAKEETTTEKQDAIENIVAEERGADSCAELPPPAALSRAGVEPTPPASPDTPQELLPVTDKLADLIPEVPVLPELNTETLQKTTSDVAVNE